MKCFGKNGMDGTLGKAVITIIGTRRRLAHALVQMSPMSLAKWPSVLKRSISRTFDEQDIHSLYSSRFSVTSRTKSSLRFSVSRSSLIPSPSVDFANPNVASVFVAAGLLL